MDAAQASIHGLSSRPAIHGRAFAGARQCRTNSPLSLRFSSSQGSGLTAHPAPTPDSRTSLCATPYGGREPEPTAMLGGFQGPHLK
jgi:hypothetical protein